MDIYSLFQKLEGKQPRESDSYYFSDIPGIKYHKLGVSSKGDPIFFVKCNSNDDTNYPSYNLGIAVDFNQECKITDGKKKIKGKYTIITLNKSADSLLQYFLNIVLFVVKSIPPNASTKLVKSEIDKLIDLFGNILEKGTGEIQGLWAELLLIEQSKNPDFLISAWHISKTSLFDFNDGENKLEVKSSKSQDRIHAFSLKQLIPNKSSNLLIASVFAVKTGVGKNVFDLVKVIESKVKNKELIITVGTIVSETLGNSINEAYEVFFDYNTGKDSIAFFDITKIPRLDAKYIPIEITNVHFDCNLNKIPEVDKSKLKSKLYKSL